jgi:hypothetical protein
LSFRYESFIGKDERLVASGKASAFDPWVWQAGQKDYFS